MPDLLTTAAVWTDTHHAAAQEEAVLAYWRGRAEGYAAGRADAEAEIRATAERMAAGIRRGGLPATAEDIVRDLVDVMAAEGRPSYPTPVVRFDDPDWPSPAQPPSGGGHD